MVNDSEIKLFQFNQKFCQMVGIGVRQMNKMCRYKVRAINTMFAISSVQFAMAALAFLLYDATSKGEYGACTFANLNTIEAVVDYFIMIWKAEEILKFIETCERFIEKSE